MARFRAANIFTSEQNMDENNIHLPQKEPLTFDLDTTGLDPHLADLVKEIRRVAESHLYHWKIFPLNLPQPVAVQEFSEGSASVRRIPLVVENLFTIPSWDDLDVVSVDSYGEPKHLTGKQLSSVRQNGYSKKTGSWRTLTTDQLSMIKKTGTFTVASVNFPGQYHTWRLSRLLQNGWQISWHSFLHTQAWAAAMIRVIASERFTGDVFSLKSSVNSIRDGVHDLLDLLFGMPSLQPRDFEARLTEERSRYLVAELLCAMNCQEEYIALCRFVRHLLTQLESNDTLLEIHQQKTPPIPYIFYTPKGLMVDLRLFSRETMDKVKAFVTTVLHQESKARWSQETKHEGKVTDIKFDHERLQNEAYERLWESLLNHPQAEQFPPGIVQLLVNQARATILMKRAVANVREKLSADLLRGEEDIRSRHPLLSLVKPWMDKRVKEIKVKLAEEYKWKCHEEAIAACRSKSLDQFVYFISRDLAFLKERAPVLSKELWADQQATRVFYWDTWIWNARNWIVKRHFQNSIEVVETRVSTTPTSITNPRTGHQGEHQHHPVYSVEKNSRRTTNTQWPLWRWANFLQRAWSWTWNASYACGYLVPWCSPLGLRALISIQPFYADLDLSQVNGALCPRRSAYTASVCSRFVSLWRHISKSRTEFETKPDTGFMGKGLNRQVDRAWNYGVKGFLGSLLLILFLPVICMLSSVGGICLAVTAPVWAPVMALVYHICLILFYDADSPNAKRSAVLPMFRVLVKDLVLGGIVEPIASLSTVLIICPLVSLLLAIYGIVHWLLSRAWDGFMYNAVIVPRGRIPASEGCLVKRIAGPGLSSEFYYQISKEQALAAFEARLEADRLVAYRRQTERLIRRPAEEFRTFVQQVFTPFSASWSPTASGDRSLEKGDSSTAPNIKSFSVAAQLERETQALLTSLEEKVERRLYQLRMPLTANVLKRIRLSSVDLKMLLARAAAMTRQFYPAEILSRVGVNETELWERYNVEEGDWLALAAIFLGEIFSAAILNPLTENETYVPLQTKDADLSRYVAMFTEANCSEARCEFPGQNFPSQLVSLPDFSYFSPLARDAVHSSPPWKKKRTPQQRERATESWNGKMNMTKKDERQAWNCELQVPMPIPHPVLICLLIYNRHRDLGAISLESESCRLLLRWLEGSIAPSAHKKDLLTRPQLVLNPTDTKSPASHRPLLGSCESELELSQQSLGGTFSRSTSTGSATQHDTLVSMAQDGTLSLVGTLMSDHASVDMGLDTPEEDNVAECNGVEVEAGISKGITSSLARAAGTLRVVLLGEKAEDQASGGRKFSAENFELLPSEDQHQNEDLQASPSEIVKKFPPYQPASFRSWRMNLPAPLRKQVPEVVAKTTSSTPPLTAPRPLGILELSGGLAADRGPAFSPAQLSIGKKMLNRENTISSGSQDSLPFAEEDASLVESPDWDQAKNVGYTKQDPPRAIGQPYCEMQRPTAVLASLEDLSLSVESQHTHLDITSNFGTQV